ncbi:MAG: hypothetical protein AB1779_08055, partial [Candidatus Thermoplasmatota archaeon]
MKAYIYIIILFSFGVLFLLANSNAAPPPEGDWIITGSVYEPSGMFTLKGNLTIKAGGALKLDTVSLFIDVKYNG